jgi:hypothetical protein
MAHCPDWMLRRSTGFLRKGGHFGRPTLSANYWASSLIIKNKSEISGVDSIPLLHRGATRMLGATYIQRHPKTGGYWFRRRVPDQLRSVIGQREITRTLGTKSLNEAKRRSRSLANATDELFIEASARKAERLRA